MEFNSKSNEYRNCFEILIFFLCFLLFLTKNVLTAVHTYSCVCVCVCVCCSYFSDILYDDELYPIQPFLKPETSYKLFQIVVFPLFPS